MMLERNKRFAVWMIMDADGYATEIVVTDGTKPQGHRVVPLSAFINAPVKREGGEFSYDGTTLAGLPLNPPDSGH